MSKYTVENVFVILKKRKEMITDKFVVFLYFFSLICLKLTSMNLLPNNLTPIQRFEFRTWKK